MILARGLRSTGWPCYRGPTLRALSSERSHYVLTSSPRQGKNVLKEHVSALIDNLKNKIQV